MNLKIESIAMLPINGDYYEWNVKYKTPFSTGEKRIPFGGIALTVYRMGREYELDAFVKRKLREVVRDTAYSAHGDDWREYESDYHFSDADYESLTENIRKAMRIEG